nr:hypothetical protein [Oligoflexales bacterium]
KQLVRYKDNDIARKSLLKSIGHSFVELQKIAAKTLPSLDLQADDISILQTIMQSNALSGEVLSSLGLAAEMIFTTDAFNLIYENVEQVEETLRAEYLDRLQRMFEKSPELISTSTAFIVIDKLKSSYKEVRIFSAVLSPLQPSIEMTTAVIAIITDEEKSIRDLGFEYLTSVDSKYINKIHTPILVESFKNEINSDNKLKIVEVLSRSTDQANVVTFAIKMINDHDPLIRNKLLALLDSKKIELMHCKNLAAQLSITEDLEVREKFIFYLKPLKSMECTKSKLALTKLEKDGERALVLDMLEQDIPLIFSSSLETNRSNLVEAIYNEIRTNLYTDVRLKLLELLNIAPPTLTYKSFADLLIPSKASTSSGVDSGASTIAYFPAPEVCNFVLQNFLDHPIQIPSPESGNSSTSIIAVVKGYYLALSLNIPDSACENGDQIALDIFMNNNNSYATKYLIPRLEFILQADELELVVSTLKSRISYLNRSIEEIKKLLSQLKTLTVRTIALDLLLLLPASNLSTVPLLVNFYKENNTELRLKMMNILNQRTEFLNQIDHRHLVDAIKKKDSIHLDAKIFAAKFLAQMKDVKSGNLNDLIKASQEITEPELLEAVLETIAILENGA